MNKDLTFRGVTLTPYSDVSPDGQLSVCHGLENYNGGIRPSLIHGSRFKVDGEMVHVHVTGQYSHVIYTDSNGDFMYYDTHDSSTGFICRRLSDDGGEVKINHVGNVLVLLAESRAPYYVMWNGQEYVDLGEIPELNVKFALRSQLVSEELEEFDHNAWSVNPQSDSEKLTDYNYAAASVSNFIEKQCNEGGRFVFPFFARAAYRLADGSHIMHTPPVLMIPNSAGPYCTTAIKDKMNAFGFASKLEAVIGYIPSEWSCLISAIDIFVSEPIDPFVYDFDNSHPDLEYITNLPVSTADNVRDFVNYGIGLVEDDNITQLNRGNWNVQLATSQLGKGMTRNMTYGFYSMSAAWVADAANFPKHTFRLRHKTDTYDPEQVSSFYFAGSHTLSDMDEHIAEIKEVITMPKGYYNNLRFKERMDDDYQSHDVISSMYGHVYNGRLSVVCDEIRHFVGHGINNVMAYQDADKDDSLSINFFYLTSRNGKETWHKMAGETHKIGYLKCLNHIFTPSLAAKEVAFSIDNGVETCWYRLKLKNHQLLSGQYYMHDYLSDYNSINNILVYDDHGHIIGRDEAITGYVECRGRYTDDVESIRNMIRTSRANNPLSFPAEGELVVGNMGIVGMSGITNALSTGQFGGYPLMVFCEDGNYALSVLDSGWYGDVRPMKRDVCINRDSITPIDGAIIFTSKKGVMIFNGNEVECISKDLDGSLDTFAKRLSADWCNLSLSSDMENPTAFIRNCRYIWDYADNRLICMRRGCVLAWVRNMEDCLWYTIRIDYPVSALNSYPYAYIQHQDGFVTRLDESRQFGANDESKTGLIITRPIKFDTLQYKKLLQFCLQGIFREYQNVSLYGSQDCKTWNLIGKTNRTRVERLAGRWYKFIRFVISTDMNEAENISAIRLDYNIRNETQLR